MVLDFIDYAMIAQTYMIKRNTEAHEIIHPDEWKKSFSDMFQNSLLVCDILLRNYDAYAEETRALAVNAGCARPKSP